MTRPISRMDPSAEPGGKPPIFRARSEKEARHSRLGIERFSAFGKNVNWKIIGGVFSVLLAVAVWIIFVRIVQDISWNDVRQSIGRTNGTAIGLSFLATAASYSALVGYDALALRQVGASGIPLRFIAFTSFIAQALTFTLGFGLATGGFVRLRLYRSQNLQPSRIIAVGILCTSTFWLGLTAAGGLSLLVAPQFLSTLDGLSRAQNFIAGFAIVAALGSTIAYTSLKPRTVRIGTFDLRLLGPKETLLSIFFGLADTAAASLALWLLLPSSVAVSYPALLIVFSAATLVGVLSNAPGGLGVFEAIVMVSLKDVPQGELLASLLMFRIVYYLIPFSLAGVLFAFHESKHGIVLPAGLRHAAAILRPLVPVITSFSVFLGGFVLLISGALPALEDRMAILRRTLPLPFVETSHFLASVIGALLLVVAWGLQQKLRSAWRAAVALLWGAAVFSLFKGIDYEESILCFAVIGLLAFGHSEFYRKGGLLDTDPSLEWVSAALISAGASIWIGAVIYHNAGYENHLWWDFAYPADEPRFLRATLGIAAVFLIIVSYRILHRSTPMRDPATASELEKAAPLIAASTRAEANLAFLQDKRLLFSKDGTGFIMYGVRGRTWIAMGDPVATGAQNVTELVWHFRELADEHRGVPVFYQATTAYLPVYLDAGFSMAKLGEEAWVDLATFTLEGKEGRRVRQALAAAKRSEATVEIVLAAKIGPYLRDMKRVSDAWLAARRSGEKGFSLGFWSEPYLCRYDHAIVRHFGEIVAFANIWKSDQRSECSVDLMRYMPDAPPGTMDLLCISLMQRARSEGFRWFNLGMAPLSGLPDHRLANIWSRFGTLIFRYGDRFYNFAGLRSFKNKFKPEWRPRYLAYPGGTFAKVLVDVTTLIARSPGRARRSEELG